ncbi:MAG TPA: DUF58 domain-containing protein [Burkholderiales bacterium]
MSAAGAAGASAGLPRLVPRGVRPDEEELLGLRRHGAVMRRVLALDDERREGRRAPPARSQGMDYAESRPYTPGDDVRRIDWRVTARTGRAHTKVFRPEPGGDLFCLVDQRAAMRFGTRAAFKSVLAAHLAALAGWAAVAGGERFGALIAGAQATSVPPGASEGAVAALCAALASEAIAAEAFDEDAGAAPLRTGTPESGVALDRLAARAAGQAGLGTRFVVISDFAEPEATLERAAGALRARGELILVAVLDALEVRLPPPARYPLTDGREQLVLDTGRAPVRAAHARDLQARRTLLARLAARPGTRCHEVRTGEDLFAALARPFAARVAA